MTTNETTNDFEWTFDCYPVQKQPDSMMLATVEGGHIYRIELSESDDQRAQREAYDGSYGDAGFSWLIYGHFRNDIEHEIIAWMEIVPAVPVVKP